MQYDIGGGCDRNAAPLILHKAYNKHGGACVDELTHELDPESVFGLKPGTDFSNVA